MTRREFARALRKSFLRRHGHLAPLPEDADGRLGAVEARLGFALPPVVRFAYKHAGEDFVDPEWSAGEYLRWREGGWPERVLPLAEEGCGVWLCVDCSHKLAPVLRWRGDLAPEGNDAAFEHESASFAEWLRGLLARD